MSINHVQLSKPAALFRPVTGKRYDALLSLELIPKPDPRV